MIMSLYKTFIDDDNDNDDDDDDDEDEDEDEDEILNVFIKRIKLFIIITYYWNTI